MITEGRKWLYPWLGGVFFLAGIAFGSGIEWDWLPPLLWIIGLGWIVAGLGFMVWLPIRARLQIEKTSN